MSTIDSLKHTRTAQRSHTASQQEAGTEPAPNRPAHDYPLNPITTRGQDPELFWMNKYGADNRETRLQVDIRSLYRYEHIAPEVLIQRLYRLKEVGPQQLDINALFGNALDLDELDKPGSYYKHSDGWTNRLIQGDSLLVMTSLLDREGMAGKVQMVYIDPPYGIKYGSNWQMRLNDRNVKDGDDASLTGEPEVIKAFRDTWELGIHSYLSDLRERLLVVRDLLSESGSCFVQISDENVHLVRCVMDEVFGSGSFVSLITFKTTSSLGGSLLGKSCDYLVWYARDIESIKYRSLFVPRGFEDDIGNRYTRVELPNGSRRVMTTEERADPARLPAGSRIYRHDNLTSQSGGEYSRFSVEFEGRRYLPGRGHWKTNQEGISRLIAIRRIAAPTANSLAYVRYLDDFPFGSLSNVWIDTQTGAFTDEKRFVVQTNRKVIERCILMTTDPGDLVLDPTCGSGTTAYVAEQWGRRWITIDTSRIALNIAKTRLMTATFPWYKLHDDQGGDIRQGFIYKRVPHITLKSLANDEPPEEETLYDQPEVDRKKLRVAGPFMVETLQTFEPLPPEVLDSALTQADDLARFERRVFEHLKSAGVKNGIKEENAVFTRINRLTSSYLHAEGFYVGRKEIEGKGETQEPPKERKAYLHIGPHFGAVSRTAVNEAIRECRERGDADWLIILGFAFESDIRTQHVGASASQPAPASTAVETVRLGGFWVTKVRMHDDLLQEGLLKRDKKAASFVTIGEPDIALHIENGQAVVEVRGLDIYDPIRDDVKPRSVADIAYWMVDDDYDRSNFVVRQVFFCGGDKDGFDKWKRGLSDLAKQSTKRKAERTLKIEIDDDAFDRLYSFRSHPISATPGRRIAVRVISQFGEESTKVMEISASGY